MGIWTIAMSILGAVIVVVDYRRVAACTPRQGRHGRAAEAPTPIPGQIAGSVGRTGATCAVAVGQEKDFTAFAAANRG